MEKKIFWPLNHSSPFVIGARRPHPWICGLLFFNSNKAQAVQRWSRGGQGQQEEPEVTGKPALCRLLADAPAFSSEAAPVGFALHCLGLTLSSQLFLSQVSFP